MNAMQENRGTAMKLATRGLVVLLVVVSMTGCTSPVPASSPSTPSTTAAEGSVASETTTTREPTVATVNVTGGSLSYDADRVWRRVQRKLGTNVTPPKVVIKELDVAGTVEDGVVYVDPSATDEESKTVLAHEFAHYVQMEVAPWPGRYASNPDERFVVRAYREGVASYVQQWYRERYPPGVPARQNLTDHSPGARWVEAQYVFGLDYVQYRAGHADELGPLLSDRWPSTSEQILHPSRGTEPPAALSVRPASANRQGYAEYLPLRNAKRMGELALRFSIWSRTNDSTAARAASGWGNDRFMTFQGPDGEGYAWVIRYDDPAEAREAQASWRTYHANDPRTFGERTEYIASRSPDDRFVNAFWRADSNRSFGTTLVDDETLVVFAGPESFVANASASGTAGNVTVRVAGPNLTANASQDATATSNASRREALAPARDRRPPREKRQTGAVSILNWLSRWR